MKKILLFIALLSGFSLVQGKNNSMGIWVQGGNPGETWGFDVKHLGTSVANDFYFRFKASNGTYAAAFYYGHHFIFPIIKADASMGKFPLHFGPTAGFGYWDNGYDGNFSLRGGASGGISWVLPSSFPMDISAELNPALEYRSDGSGVEFPALYFRLLFHAYFF